MAQDNSEENQNNEIGIADVGEGLTALTEENNAKKKKNSLFSVKTLGTGLKSFSLFVPRLTMHMLNKQKKIELCGSGQYVGMFFFAILLTAINLGYVSKIPGIGVILSSPAVIITLVMLYLLFFIYVFKDSVSNKTLFYIILFGIVFVYGLSSAMINHVLNFIPHDGFRFTMRIFFLILGYGFPIFMLMQVKHERSKATEILWFVFYAAIIVLLLGTFSDEILMSLHGGPADDATREGIMHSLIKGFKGFFVFIGDSVQETKDSLNESMAKIQGKSYEEKVDDAMLMESLGLNFKELRFSNPDKLYYEGDAVTSWVTLEVQTLDRSVDISTGCVVDLGDSYNDVKVGKISKEDSSFSVIDIDFKEMMCKFDEDTFDKDNGYSHKLSIYAIFDFTTNSYLRRYFSLDSDYLELIKQGQDPIQFYQIDRSDEFGKFSNGPLKLEVKKEKLLQPLKEEGVNKFIVGISVDTNPKLYASNPALIKVKNLVIALPKGMAINREGGKYQCGQYNIEDYDEDACIGDCVELNKGERCIQDCSDYRMYHLVGSDKKSGLTVISEDSKGFEYIKTPFEIPCVVEIRDPDVLLEGGKLAIENLRSYIDYEFRISSEDYFTVLEKKGYVNPHKLKTLSANCGDYVTSFIDSDSVPESTLNYIEDNFVDNLNEEGWKDSYFSASEGICSPILKALVAFQTRNGLENVQGGGVTGVTKESLTSLGIVVPDDLSTNVRSNIVAASEFLSKKLNSPDCVVGEHKSLDCALGYLLCGQDYGPCFEDFVPQVIKITQAVIEDPEKFVYSDNSDEEDGETNDSEEADLSNVGVSSMMDFSFLNKNGVIKTKEVA